jgi:hypothetical protein
MRAEVEPLKPGLDPYGDAVYNGVSPAEDFETGRVGRLERGEDTPFFLLDASRLK